MDASDASFMDTDSELEETATNIEISAASDSVTSDIHTFCLVGDNIDKSIKPRYMRVHQGNQLLHYFHYIAIADRIDFSHLSIRQPVPPTIPYKECAKSLLPSVADNQALKRNMITLVSRILVTNVDSLNFNFCDVVDWHIPTAYQDEMSKESEVVKLQ